MIRSLHSKMQPFYNLCIKDILPRINTKKFADQKLSITIQAVNNNRNTEECCNKVVFYCFSFLRMCNKIRYELKMRRILTEASHSHRNKVKKKRINCIFSWRANPVFITRRNSSCYYTFIRITSLISIFSYWLLNEESLHHEILTLCLHM